MTKRKARYTTLIVASCVIVTLSATGVYLVSGLMGAKVDVPKKLVQEVRIIRPPPPPPDVEPPPPPPPQEEVDLPEPEPQQEASNDPPPGEQLGIDAEGGAGDSFGLVGRPGGRDLLASGGSAYAWYAGLIKNEILDHLEDEKGVRSGSYSVVVRLWVRRDGSVEKATLAGSTGNRERDRAIEQSLSQISRLSQAPPANMPQPISLRIVSRA